MAELQQVSRLLEALDDPNLGNNERNQCEFELEELKQQHGNPSFALALLNQQQPRLHWFAAMILEGISRHDWSALSQDIRQGLLQELAGFLEQHFDALAPFARSKLLLSFVLMGLQETNGVMPDFIPNVLEWCKTTSLLGFTCLKTIAEEVGGMNEAHQATFLNHLPAILELLSTYFWLCHRDPTLQQRQTSRALGHSKPLPSTPRASPSDKMLTGRQRPNEEEPVFNVDAVGVALEALAVMFTWISFDKLLTEDLFQVLCQLGLPRVAGANTALLALRTLNEIHQQVRIPPLFGSYTAEVYKYTLQLLTELKEAYRTKIVETASDYEYIDTVIEFLRLFLTNYVKRTLNSAELPHSELLTLLGDFILVLDDPDLFGHATSAVLDFVTLFVEDELNQFEAGRQQCEHQLVQLIEPLFHKLHASSSVSIIHLVNFPSDQQNVSSDFEQHIQGVGNVVASITTLYPQPAMGLLLSKIQSGLQEVSNELAQAQPNTIVFRDFDVTCRIFAITADTLVHHFHDFFTATHELLTALLNCFSATAAAGVMHAESNTSPWMSTMIVLEALLPWCEGLTQLAQQEPNFVGDVTSLCQIYADMVEQVLSTPNLPTEQRRATCALLASATFYIKSSVWYHQTAFPTVLQLVAAQWTAWDQASVYYAMTAAVHVLLTRWENVSDPNIQLLEHRQGEYVSLCEHVATADCDNPGARLAAIAALVNQSRHSGAQTLNQQLEQVLVQLLQVIPEPSIHERVRAVLANYLES
eukprot:TRINITY_DN11880_c0_g1_i8.p1 TRINITY_DN11880_c0_g1~~TRINITY_DN11880_c0_g1_i8.p1  ORF type:complete len:757 (+),score=151.14 TRINITY_DN11880_c0_g1_i8:1-2271(+)